MRRSTKLLEQAKLTSLLQRNENADVAVNDLRVTEEMSEPEEYEKIRGCQK